MRCAGEIDGNDFEMDVTSPYSVRHAVECVERDSGPVSILVNNAGTDWFGFFKDTDEDLWARVVDINLMGVLRATHAVLPGMIERGRRPDRERRLGGRAASARRLGRLFGRQGRGDRVHEDDRPGGRALRTCSATRSPRGRSTRRC